MTEAWLGFQPIGPGPLPSQGAYLINLLRKRGINPDKEADRLYISDLNVWVPSLELTPAMFSEEDWIPHTEIELKYVGLLCDKPLGDDGVKVELQFTFDANLKWSHLTVFVTYASSGPTTLDN